MSTFNNVNMRESLNIPRSSREEARFGHLVILAAVDRALSYREELS